MASISEVVEQGETLTLHWDDGTWWQLLKEEPWGVGQDLQERMSAFATVEGEDFAERLEAAGLTWQDAIRMEGEARILRIAGCTVSWSWDEAVTAESVRRRSRSKVERVSRELEERNAGDEPGTKKA